MTALSNGFERPVFDAQASFRGIMRAMAEPGRIERIGARTCPPADLSPAAGACLLTLLDHETSIWIDLERRGENVLADWLRFHTGVRLSGAPKTADFALVAPHALGALGGWALGSDVGPHRSATLIVEVEALAPEGPLRLSGPGIEGARRLTVAPLPEGFLPAWARNRAIFPRGVDLILAAGETIAALPRTTAVETAEG